MAKRKQRRKPRERREPTPTTAYTDADGNVLELRIALSPGTIAELHGPVAAAASSLDDAWHRRMEMLFERLTVSWEIAGMPLTDQKMLLGRYRMADAATQAWVRQTIAAHVERHLPELADSDS